MPQPCRPSRYDKMLHRFRFNISTSFFRSCLIFLRSRAYAPAPLLCLCTRWPVFQPTNARAFIFLAGIFVIALPVVMVRSRAIDCPTGRQTIDSGGGAGSYKAASCTHYINSFSARRSCARVGSALWLVTWRAARLRCAGLRLVRGLLFTIAPPIPFARPARCTVGALLPSPLRACGTWFAPAKPQDESRRTV